MHTYNVKSVYRLEAYSLQESVTLFARSTVNKDSLIMYAKPSLLVYNCFYMSGRPA